MAERGITDSDVRATLESPDTTMPAHKNRTKYIKHKVGSRSQVAVVAMVRKQSADHFVVYTVF